MSEIKRVVLNTLEPQKVNDKVSKKQCKTTRISVVLPESNEDKCPEFNYKDELAAVKKKGKQIKDGVAVENGLDPFENDDDVRRIAAEMEAKYGTTVTGNKTRRKGRKDDYADIGMGYDESDSFIDNTDGYDEIIPQNVTTLHGGFYINSGALEFKTDDEASSAISSSSDESETEGKVRRKRVLDTSDDESDAGSPSHIEKKPKLLTPKNTMQQAIKKKLFSQKKIQVKKRRLLDPLKKTVKDLLREKREDLNMSIPGELQIEKNAELLDALKENKKPMSIVSVTDAIESVIKQADTIATPKIENKAINHVDVPKKDVPPVKSDTQPLPDPESSHATNKPEKVEIVKLPENLPSDILDIINNIKKAALDYRDGGKVKFFTGGVNTMLLNLERKCKCLGKSSRTRVYEHLAPFVKCRKETVIRRARNLVMEDEERKLAKLVLKLKTQIDQIMPSVISNYEKESQKILQKKFSQEAMENEELKSLKIPRRRFHCPEEMKKLLRDILAIKKRCLLLLEGKQKDSLEEQLTEFLKADIQTLWPDGWMSVTYLKKLCNSMIRSPDGKSDSNHPKHSQNNSLKINQVNNNLTITPITNNVSSKMTSVVNDISVSKISNSNNALSQKIPENIVKTSSNVPKIEKPRQEIKPPKQATESGVIVVNMNKPKEEKEKKDNLNTVIPKPTHCPVIDLTELARSKQKEDPRPFKYVKECAENLIKSNLPPEINSLKHSELNITPNFFNNGGDEIKMVMENLKALQKLSSPVKSESSTSSPVSVIAFNKNYLTNSNSGGASSVPARTDYVKSEFGGVGFQDEFQKQFISSLSQISSASVSSKSNYNRCS